MWGACISVYQLLYFSGLKLGYMYDYTTKIEDVHEGNYKQRGWIALRTEILWNQLATCAGEFVVDRRIGLELSPVYVEYMVKECH